MKNRVWVFGLGLLVILMLTMMPTGLRQAVADSGGYGGSSASAETSAYGSSTATQETSAYGSSPAKEESSAYGGSSSSEESSAYGSSKKEESGGYGESTSKESSAYGGSEEKESGGYGSEEAAPAKNDAAPAKQAAAKAPKAGTYPKAGFMFIATAILCGMALGWILQRGRFCMNSAFRDTIFIQDHTYFRAYILALAVAIIGANAFSDLGLFGSRGLAAQPFWPLAHIIGGYVFGLGIVLAGGCGSGIWYRVGEGQLNALVAVLGFFVGIATTMSGILEPIYKASRSVMWLENNPTVYDVVSKLTGQEGSLVVKWGVILVLCAGMLFYVNKSQPFKFGKQKGYYWSVTGVLLGVIAVVAFWASYKFGGGFTRGLSFTTPTIELFNTILRHDASPTIFPMQSIGFVNTTWGVFFIVAVPFGAFLSAKGMKEFALKVPPATELLTVFGGSLLMGFGATLALGCNMGQGITGASTLSVGSIIATIAIILGNWTMVYYKFIKPMNDMDDDDL